MAYTSVEIESIPFVTLVDGVVKKLQARKNDGTYLEIDVALNEEVTAAVEAAVAALVDGAPGALNTLNELSAALGDDEDFAVTVAAALADKVPQNPTLAITYNPDGTIATTTENGVLSTFSYNPDGSVDTITRLGVTRTFSYNPDGTISGAA